MCLIAGSAATSGPEPRPYTPLPKSAAGAARRTARGPSQSRGPAGPAERSVLRGPGPLRGPASDVQSLPVLGPDSTGTGESDCPVAGLGSLLQSSGAGRPAGGGSGWSGGELGAPAGPSSLADDSECPEQVPPGPCTDAFPR